MGGPLHGKAAWRMDQCILLADAKLAKFVLCLWSLIYACSCHEAINKLAATAPVILTLNLTEIRWLSQEIINWFKAGVLGWESNIHLVYFEIITRDPSSISCHLWLILLIPRAVNDLISGHWGCTGSWEGIFGFINYQNPITPLNLQRKLNLSYVLTAAEYSFIECQD